MSCVVMRHEFRSIRFTFRLINRIKLNVWPLSMKATCAHWKSFGIERLDQDLSLLHVDRSLIQPDGSRHMLDCITLSLFYIKKLCKVKKLCGMRCLL